MQVSSHTSQREAWKDRFAAIQDLPQVLKLLWDSAAFWVSMTTFLRVLGGLVPLATLWVAKQIIDLVAGAAKTPNQEVGLIWKWVAIEFALAAGAQIIGRAIDYYDARIADKFTHDLGLKVMKHASTLDLASFEDPAFHDRLERARAQTTDRIGMLTSTGWLLQRIVMLLSLAGGIVYYSPWLLGVLILCVVPAFLGESHFAFLGYTLAHELTPIRRGLEYFLRLGSSREAAKEVKMFALSPHLQSRYQDLSNDVIERNAKLARRRLWWGAALAVFATVGYYGGYAYLAYEALNQRLSVGTFAFMIGAIAGANGHLQAIFSLFSNIADQALFLRDLVMFLREKPKIRSKVNPLPAPRPIRSGLEFDKVCFQYPDSDRLILDRLSFRMEPGQRVALVGENGQGKTTFVKLIARLYDPTAGRILLDGCDLRDYNVEELRHEIGVIFQDFIRYDMSVRENIAAGRIRLLQDDNALMEAARHSNADQLLANLSGGLEHMLGRRFEGGSDLSGGEWQKVALARAYLRDAQLLILDEPTAALDPMAEYEVFNKFAELTLGRMALFISHRFSTVRMADRIVVLSNGNIIEDGTHDELLSVSGEYAKLFEIQAASYR